MDPQTHFLRSSGLPATTTNGAAEVGWEPGGCPLPALGMGAPPTWLLRASC